MSTLDKPFADVNTIAAQIDSKTHNALTQIKYQRNMYQSEDIKALARLKILVFGSLEVLEKVRPELKAWIRQEVEREKPAGPASAATAWAGNTVIVSCSQPLDTYDEVSWVAASSLKESFKEKKYHECDQERCLLAKDVHEGRGELASIKAQN